MWTCRDGTHLSVGSVPAGSVQLTKPLFRNGYGFIREHWRLGFPDDTFLSIFTHI